MIDPLSLPKAELHLHVEGTLEPELMLRLARRNGVSVPYRDVESVRAAYRFSDLQSFLDIYYQACSVLLQEEDFYELTMAYLARARAQGVRHVEMFFDPQTHTARGVDMGTVVAGISRALGDGDALGVTSRLILCFLRHLPEAQAMATLDLALEHGEVIAGVGLDSSELGNPPERFERVFARARDEGLHAVAHAGEEGPPEYIWQALDVLGAERIDHGVTCLRDPGLVQRIVSESIPLTVCPLSNVKLRVFERLEDHPLPAMLDRGIRATVNSDDPAYFGGYVGDNFSAVSSTFRLGDEALVDLARHSFEASFLDEDTKAAHLEALDSAIAGSSA